MVVEVRVCGEWGVVGCGGVWVWVWVWGVGHGTVVVVHEDELLDEVVEHVAERGVGLVHELAHVGLAGVVQRRQLLREEDQQVAQARVRLRQPTTSHTHLYIA